MKDWLIFSLLALLLWGLWGFFPKLASNYISSKSFLIYDIIGTVAIGVIVLFVTGFKLETHNLGITYGILAGIAGTLGLLFFLFAISKGKVSIIAPLTALYPVVTILLAFLILKEPITLKQGIGIVLALVSILLLSI